MTETASVRKVTMTPTELGTVQRTLLTPLVARADQYPRQDAILRDHKAFEIAKRLAPHYQSAFLAIRRFPDTLTGCAIRAAVFDRWIRRFLDRHRDAAVISIAEGLDTTFERNDDGRSVFFELDFPDVIALRRELFADHPRRSMIAGSVFDKRWIDRVRSSGRNAFLFQAAGLTMYLPPERVREMLTLLADHFPGCTFLFDTCSTLAKRNSRRWEATVRTTGAVYQFGIDQAKDICQWDSRFRVLETEYMMDHHRRQWSAKTRFVSALSRSLRTAYQLNRAVLG